MSFSNGNHDMGADGDGFRVDPGQPPAPEVDELEIAQHASGEHARRRRVWPWVVLGVAVVAAAACGGTYAYFQNRALPGTTLWGHSVAGRSEQQIARMIDDQIAAVQVPVTYEGTQATIDAADLGIDVDADAIAKQAVDAKRDGSFWTRYLPWDKRDVAPTITPETDPTVLDAKLGTSSAKPVDATLRVTEDGTHVETVPGANGSGADAKAVADEAVAAIESLGSAGAKTVALTMDTIEPNVPDATADQARDALNRLIDAKAGITVGDEKVATFSPAALVDASRIEPNEESTLKDGETRSGVVVFDAGKLQSHYDEDIKPHYSTTKEDREVIVNNNDEDVVVLKEGHDGVRIKDGADQGVGEQAAKAFAAGDGDVKVDGEVDPMAVKKTKRHVVVDLSDHKVYAYENGKQVKAFSMSAGQGNDYATGACQPSGDLCTPLGDFEVWLKYPSQHMSGTLTLSDGTKETWDAPDVGFVNYFSKSGCAIHRIATDAPYSDAQIAALGANTSHGCVGIGWDVAEWFYDFAVQGPDHGVTVHVQQ
ncbi:MAG: L,D-transpeptidase family protein [Bifidobacterium choerinum]